MDRKERYRKLLKLYGEKYHELKRVENMVSSGKVDGSKDTFYLESPPPRIYIEPTNRCNLLCSYCARHTMDRPLTNLSLEMFENALKGLPVGSEVNLLGNGEPLLNKNIYEMIRYAADSGFVVKMITNGTMLTPKNIERLVRSGVDYLQISFDFNENTFSLKPDQKLNGSLDVLKKIIEFIYTTRIVLKSRLFISISTVLSNEIKKNISHARKFWNSLPVNNFYEGELLSLQTNSNALNEIQNNSKEVYKVCANPFSALKISATGEVAGCVMDFSDKYIIGNVADSNISEIINSEKAVLLRKAVFECDAKFFESCGYNCDKCNAWTDQVGHNLSGYLNDGFPVTYGLLIEAISNKEWFDNEKINNIERLRKEFSIETIKKYFI